MSDSVFVSIIAFQLALLLFLYKWDREVIIAMHIFSVSIHVLGALILLITTFGMYKTLISYKLPFDDDTTYTIRVGFK